MADFFPSNPFQGSLGEFGGVKRGSRLGLDAIYKAMQRNLDNFGKSLIGRDLDFARQGDRDWSGLGSTLQGYGKQSAADVVAQGVASGGEVDAQQAADLQKIANQGLSGYQGQQRSLRSIDKTYQTGLRGLDRKYIKELKASAIKEQQARNAELEQNALDISAGIRSQGAMWDAQQQQMAIQQGQLSGVGGSGHETANVLRAMQFGAAKWGIKVGGWRATGSVPNSDHPKGLAVDYMIRSGGQGNEISSYFLQNAAQWGVKYIIWNRHINTLDGRGWRNYSGPNPHTDHVHVSFLY